MGELIRSARPDEAAALTRLAMRSKAHWGYDDAFMAVCRDELTVTQELIETAIVRVLEGGGGILGFYALIYGENGRTGVGGRHGEIELFYVAPSEIGRGYGRAMWADAIARAGALGYRHVLVHSDPHAEDFYRAMGAVRIGNVPSGSIAGRRLPLLRCEVPPVPAAAGRS